MGYIEVTSTEVRQRASALQELNGQFRNRATELETKEQSLCGMWEGEAKTVFHREFMKDRQQMNAFSQLIEQYVQVMMDIAAKYEEAERRASELASSRRY